MRPSTISKRKKTIGRPKGKKNFSQIDKDKMKSIIRGRLLFRDSDEQLLLSLEDKRFEVSLSTLTTLKKEIRDEMGKRFEEIGTYELAEEHQLAIQMMKYLEYVMTNALNSAKDVRDYTAISTELRNIKKDIIDYYGSTDIVSNVFKYFQDKYGDKAKEEYDKARKEISKE